MIVLYTSRPTAIYTQDKKDPIMVMIKTEEIKKYVKKRSIIRQNIISI